MFALAVAVQSGVDKGQRGFPLPVVTRGAGLGRGGVFGKPAQPALADPAPALPRFRPARAPWRGERDGVCWE